MLLIKKPGTKKFAPYVSKSRDDLLEKIREVTNSVPASKIFTTYYGGCGEVGGFTLREVREGVPCIRFNLD